jgi:dTDP-4-dehydrorhamnose reductase
MKPTILITGGSGLLAVNWAYAVRDRFDVTLGLHQRKILSGKISTSWLNLESVDALTKQFEVLQPQIVIHTAGLTSVEQCERDPVLARHCNVFSAENVSKACSKLKVPLVHISTDHLFSGEKSFVGEDSQIAPLNVYGSSKAEAEKRVLEQNPQALVIRTNFYGWGTSYRQSFSDFIINSLRAQKELELFEDVHYTPILAEVLALATHDLLDMKANGIFNLVGGQRLSKFDFGIKLAKVFNLDEGLIKAAHISRQSLLVKRPLEMSLSNAKAVRLLGRDLGSIDHHLSQLCQQEINGMASELKKL